MHGLMALLLSPNSLNEGEKRESASPTACAPKEPVFMHNQRAAISMEAYESPERDLAGSVVVFTFCAAVA
jgi:hypothetical protein